MGLFGDKKDKPKPDFSNVQTGGSSTAPAPETGGTKAPTPAPTTDRTYVVVKGDSLSKIAKKYYGNANKWPKIHEANRDIIKNPDLIHPGQQLRIPED